MFYLIDNDHLTEYRTEKMTAEPDSSYIGVMSFAELSQCGRDWNISSRFVEEAARSSVAKYESHDGFDYLSLNIPNDGDQRSTERICVYLTASILVFVCDDNQVVNDMIAELQDTGLKNISHGRIFHLFLDRLTYDDAVALDQLEQEITDLEESLITTKKSDVIGNIITLRKKLFSLKRYYEQFLVIAEEIEENENGFIDKKTMRYFRMITGRIDRLYHDVLNLRDYVTQVREAYQAQIDIDLNSIMKFFTVITSIFLPLTLLVGWYGMNVKMPEYGWEYGYPFVIAISIAMVAVTIFLFKKRKWF